MSKMPDATEKAGATEERACLAVLQELAAIPYENLSKIVAARMTGNGSTPSLQTSAARERALCKNLDWMKGRQSQGLGATCFGLTHALKSRLDEMGQQTAYLMGDHRNNANIHCGLLWRRGSEEFLLDPGYALYDPLPLSRHLIRETWSGPHRVRIEIGPGVWRLWTGPQNALKHRFDFRMEPVVENEFFQHWEASYAWPMMKYPVLNQVRGETQFYLQKDNLFIRTREGSEQRKLNSESFLKSVTNHFGVDLGLAEEAMSIFRAAGKTWFRG
jgi:hypothetical protein